jgi:hypothetical protein
MLLLWWKECVVSCTCNAVLAASESKRPQKWFSREQHVQVNRRCLHSPRGPAWRQQVPCATEVKRARLVDSSLSGSNASRKSVVSKNVVL